MKTVTFLLCLFAFSSLLGNEPQSRHIMLHVPGTLTNKLTTEEKKIITHLIVSGNINERDFETINRELIAISFVDLRHAIYFEYSNNDEENLYISHRDNRIITENTFGCDTSSQKESLINPIDTLYLPLSTDEIDKNFSLGRTHPMILFIPANVSIINPEAFNGFYGSIVVDSNNERFSSNDGILYDKAMKRILRCPPSKTGKIVIPSTVTTIHEKAFKDCMKLTSIILPISITKIGERAFENCINLEEINLPKGVKYIKWGTFKNCHKLKSVSFSISLLAIEGFAFTNCFSLSSITFPESIYYIGLSSFSNCYSLEIIHIPSTLTNIDIDAFEGSSGYFFVDNYNPVYSSLEGILFNKTQTILYKCSINREGEYIIPKSVTTIEEEAFERCVKLKKIVVHSEVSDIHGYAFKECQADVIIDAENKWFSYSDGQLTNKIINRIVPSPYKVYILLFAPDE